MNNDVLIRGLYSALRSTKREKFDEDDYFWKIGARVLEELEVPYSDQVYHLTKREEGVAPTLYGIKIQVDYIDLDNIRLYEDITYKIGESEEENLTLDDWTYHEYPRESEEEND